MLLEGKRIIVTGGMSGIGRATVLACVREGARVVSLLRPATPPGPGDRAGEALSPGSKLAARGSIHVVVTSRENGRAGHIYDTLLVAFRKHTLLPLNDCLCLASDDLHPDTLVAAPASAAPWHRPAAGRHLQVRSPQE